jgi:hypothetical protein
MMNNNEPKLLSSTFLILYIVVAVVFLMCFHYYCPQKELDKLANLVILLVTAATVIKYTDYTRRILTIQNKAYIESRDPIISFLLDGVEGADLKTYVRLTNHSAFDTAVWINLNLKVQGRLVRVGAPFYTGEESWNLQALQTIEGAHFIPMPEIRAQTTITITDLDLAYKSSNLTDEERNSLLTISVDVRYRGAGDQIRAKPISNWYFDFSKGKWIFKV